jgi:hypothetical protein
MAMFIYMGYDGAKEFLMNVSIRSQPVLFSITTLNLISTWLHYTDNARFLNLYPGPAWFTPGAVLAAVIVMTPIGLLGYWLYTRRLFRMSYILLGLYSITSISSPGHYLYPMVHPISLKMHSLIWLDAFSGLSLVAFLVWSCAIAKEWLNDESPCE